MFDYVQMLIAYKVYKLICFVQYLQFLSGKFCMTHNTYYECVVTDYFEKNTNPFLCIKPHISLNDDDLFVVGRIFILFMIEYKTRKTIQKEGGELIGKE